MEGTTTNINLIKPGENEFYDVNINNHNSDIIDLEIYNLKTNKVDKEEGKGLSSNDYTAKEKQKLSSIEEGANKYIHPETHSLDMITETSTKKIMTGAERTKLQGIEEGAEKNKVASVNNKTGAVVLNKSDIGLSNVDNIKQANKAEFDALKGNFHEHTSANITAHNVSRGTSNFGGNNQEVTIPHGLSVVPTSAYAFPTVNPEGYLGEVWIRMDATNLYVGNSGSFTGAMSWTAIG